MWGAPWEIRSKEKMSCFSTFNNSSYWFINTKFRVHHLGTQKIIQVRKLIIIIFVSREIEQEWSDAKERDYASVPVLVYKVYAFSFVLSIPLIPNIFMATTVQPGHREEKDWEQKINGRETVEYDFYISTLICDFPFD